jgi:hypothetical protein
MGTLGGYKQEGPIIKKIKSSTEDWARLSTLYMYIHVCQTLINLIIHLILAIPTNIFIHNQDITEQHLNNIKTATGNPK